MASAAFPKHRFALALALCAFVLLPFVARAQTPAAADTTALGCSDVDGGVEALEACVHAVRNDPTVIQASASCDLSVYEPAPALEVDDSLTAAAQSLSEDMAAADKLISRPIDEVRIFGFEDGYISESSAFFVDGSALDVMKLWMCDEGSAGRIMDCKVQFFGAGQDCNAESGKCYYTLDFGGTGSCAGGTPAADQDRSGGRFGIAPAPAPSAARRRADCPKDDLDD